MKKGLTLLVLASVVFVLVLAGLALAVKDNATGKAAGENETATGAKNMTYGQCVVAGVQIRNTCYETTKQARTDCIANASNDSAKAKQCKADYKRDTNQCKTDFKIAKKDCIQKTKPKFWERLRYALA
jgi:hypothetical protein